MEPKRIILMLMAAMAAAVSNGRAANTEMATLLLPHMDGDVYGTRICNYDGILQVGYSGKKSVAW
ncbi:MAG: hypothetical protein ABIY63_12360, partial [Fibrobacteria bacterium]